MNCLTGLSHLAKKANPPMQSARTTITTMWSVTNCLLMTLLTHQATRTSPVGDNSTWPVRPSCVRAVDRRDMPSARNRSS